MLEQTGIIPYIVHVALLWFVYEIFVIWINYKDFDEDDFGSFGVINFVGFVVIIIYSFMIKLIKEERCWLEYDGCSSVVTLQDYLIVDVWILKIVFVIVIVFGFKYLLFKAFLQKPKKKRKKVKK